MSPGQRFIHYAGSPGRYIKREIRPGSVKSSVFSLVIICLGAGTITIPYTFYALGFILGSVAVIFGGLISVFAGWMLAHACSKTKAACYEECAMVSFGKSA
jgi:amino acid permease